MEDRIDADDLRRKAAKEDLLLGPSRSERVRRAVGSRSYAEVGRLLGVPGTTVKRWCRGEFAVPDQLLDRLEGR